MRALAGYVKRELLLPVSFVLTLLGGAYWVGTLSNQIKQIIKNDSPTRIEFNSMDTQLKDIKKGVDGINNYLLNQK